MSEKQFSTLRGLVIALMLQNGVYFVCLMLAFAGHK
jgi:hypothetical protein